MMSRLTFVQMSILTRVIAMIIRCSGQTIKTCEYDAKICGCHTDEGLVSLGHFKPHGLSTEPNAEVGTFHWNPCRDFTRDGLKAACIQNISPGVKFDCGVHGNSDTKVKDGRAVFTMKSGDLLRESKVSCICGTSERLVFVNEDPTLIYNLDLISKHCCPGFHGGRQMTRYSVGSILLIVFSSMVWVYFVGGIIIQTFVRKAKGREMIPHIYFWTDLLGLIGDGLRFAFSCCRSSRSRTNLLITSSYLAREF